MGNIYRNSKYLFWSFLFSVENKSHVFFLLKNIKYDYILYENEIKSSFYVFFLHKKLDFFKIYDILLVNS